LVAIAEGLQQFEPVQGRSRAITLQRSGQPVTLVDDSYNANPDSVRAAIDVLAELPGPRLLVLGDMGEVGEQGLAFHDEVLRHALSQNIEHVLVSGHWMQAAAEPLLASAGGRLEVFDSVDALLPAACQRWPLVASALVKGSRFMRMERVVQALQAKSEEHHAEGSTHAA
jgi:UDP-N-acetylmuramoyl-tripeptide--D-alanyl-D-alanine ligase